VTADIAPGSHHRATFLVLAVAVTAYSLLQSLVLPVLPTIQASLHTSQNTVTWVLTAYLLSASVFTPILGRLGDMFGKERMLVVALASLAVGALLAALAHSITLMIVARSIQGVGGGVLPLSFGIVRDTYDDDQLPGVVGIIAGLAAAGGGIGVVLAGLIVKVLNFRWLFWLPMIVLILATVAAYVVVPKSTNRSPGRLSWNAIWLLSAWLVGLLVGVSEAPVWGWGSVRVLALLAISVALAIAWVVVETRSTHPLIDMKMMRIPVVWTTNLVAFLFGIGLYSTFTFVPEFLQAPTSTGYGFGASVIRSGLVLLPMGSAMFVFSLMSGRLTSRFGSKSLLLIGSTISIVTFAMLTAANGHEWEMFVAMGVQGIGFGLAFAAMSSLIVEGVPASQTGVASGMNANIRTIGGSIGAAVVSSIVAASAHGRVLPQKSGYTHGFLVLTVATAAAAAATLLVPAVRRVVSAQERQQAMPHAELGILAAGTLLGTDPE
jgi:EmrB/QacA subfamily drug resistance transporter